jgi:Interferon-induced transmembrane protein
MTEPGTNYPVPPPPPTSPWTAQDDPYAPYAPRARRAGAGEPPPYEPYAGGPAAPPPYTGGPGSPWPGAAPLPYEPYAGGPGHSGPGFGTPPYGGQKPSAYWPLSIVGVLFSFLFGGIAVYFSVQVGRRWERGDIEGARKASRTARTLGIVAIVVGAVGTAILLGTGYGSS